MARIMFAWECGGGFGHISRYVKLIDQLVKDKQEILFVSKNVANAEMLFRGKPVQIAQAPALNETPAGGVSRPKSYVHVLRNQGFASREGLLGRLKAWKSIYQSSSPDLVICDHSPTAVLASHCLDKRSLVLSGNGFALPPNIHPMAPFHLADQLSANQLLQEEQILLADYINPSMEALNSPGFERLCEVFESDDRWLHSCKEMDHYPDRDQDAYLGVENEIKGTSPNWPELAGPRIFAYLKPYKHIEILLAVLQELSYPTLIVGDHIPESFEKRFSSPGLRFPHELLNLSLVARDIEFAITNSNAGSTSQFLLHGVPLLLIPLHIEQHLSAVTIEKMGCGIHVEAARSQKDQLTNMIELLLEENNSYRQKAIEFSKKYPPQQLGHITEYMYSKIQGLLDGRGL